MRTFLISLIVTLPMGLPRTQGGAEAVRAWPAFKRPNSKRHI